MKIADFGLSRFRVEYTMTFCGSPKWTAPEVLNGESYGTAADSWSFGVVLWEMATRKVPYAAGTWQTSGAAAGEALSRVPRPAPGAPRRARTRAATAARPGSDARGAAKGPRSLKLKLEGAQPDAGGARDVVARRHEASCRAAGARGAARGRGARVAIGVTGARGRGRWGERAGAGGAARVAGGGEGGARGEPARHARGARGAGRDGPGLPRLRRARPPGDFTRLPLAVAPATSRSRDPTPAARAQTFSQIVAMLQLKRPQLAQPAGEAAPPASPASPS